MDALVRTSRASKRRGFSMIEALLSVTIATIAGAAMLTSVGAAVGAADQLKNANIARGLAEQLLDEIAGVRFPAASSPALFGAIDRLSFDDIDDYSGLNDTPPSTRDNQPIGSEVSPSDGSVSRPTQTSVDADYMRRFARVVSVERVEPNVSGSWNVVSTHTDYRRVRVDVQYTDFSNTAVSLVSVTRIFSNVAFTP